MQVYLTRSFLHSQSSVLFFILLYPPGRRSKILVSRTLSFPEISDARSWIFHTTAEVLPIENITPQFGAFDVQLRVKSAQSVAVGQTTLLHRASSEQEQAGGAFCTTPL